LRYEKDDLFVNPRLEKLYDAFHDFINEVANIIRYLPPLQSWIRIKEKQRGENMADINVATNDKVTIASLPNWYMDDVHQRLTGILKECFQPLNDYMQGLRLRFGNIIYKTDEAHHEVAIMSTEKKYSLEEYVATVEDYNQLIRAINGMVFISFTKHILLYL